MQDSDELKGIVCVLCEAIVNLANGQLEILHALASLPGEADAGSRRKILDQIAQRQTQIERLQATMRDYQKRLSK